MTGQRFVYVTGKGGVGKTAVALALGLASAASGRRTIVCEQHGQWRVPRAFDLEQPDQHAEVAVAPGLWTISIDPPRALAEWLGGTAGRAAAAMLVRAHAVEQLVAAAPGAFDLVTLGKAFDLTRERRRDGRRGYDRVVVDGPPTAQAVAQLHAPREYAALVRRGPVGDQARDLAGFIADPGSTRVVVVTLPTELAVNETLGLTADIERELGRPVDLVLVNQVLPLRFAAEEVDLIEHAAATRSSVARAAADAVRRLWARSARQQEQISRLRAGVDAQLRELPYLVAPRIGRQELEQLAELVMPPSATEPVLARVG